MSISQVHLLTAGLGVIACLALLGICHSRPVLRESRWSLGVLAALILAASPLVRFWYPFADSPTLLQMSLLVSCIGLSALLLVAILFHRQMDLQPDAAGEMMAADSSSVSQSDTPQPATSGLPPGHLAQVPDADAITAGLPVKSSPVAIILDADGPAQAVSHAFESTGPDDDLDLSETERLFAELRQQQDTPAANDAELPESSDWVNAESTDAPLNLEPLESDLSIEPASDRLPLAEPPAGDIADVEDADIISIESADAGKSSLDMDDTIDYATPANDDSTPVSPANTSASNDAAPEATALTAGAPANRVTSIVSAADDASASKADAHEPDMIEELDLDKALQKARQAESQLQEQLAALHNSMNLLHQQYDSASVTEGSERLAQMQSLVNSESLAQAEGQARAAAEALVATQRKLLVKALQQRRVAQVKLLQAEALQARHEAAAERCKLMARQAAQLARQAAVAQTALKATAIREQQARLKSEQSAQRAVSIARNAIDALQTGRPAVRAPHR